MNDKIFKKWFDSLSRAWIARNPGMVASLCAENVAYYEDPFQKPLRGRSAVRKVWKEVPRSQKDIHFTYLILGISGNMGIAHWSASFTRIPIEVKAELDGIFTVILNKEGLCKEFHQWWNSKES